MLAGLAFVVLYGLAVLVAPGQRLDHVAGTGFWHWFDPWPQLLADWLPRVWDASLALLGVLCAVAAWSRRRDPALVVRCAALVGGSVLLAQLGKAFLPHPDLDPSKWFPTAVRGFPSGHTAASVSMAAVLVLLAPHGGRSRAGRTGGLLASLVVATLLAHAAHRPADTAGSVLVVLALGALVVRATAAPRPDPRRTAALRALARRLSALAAVVVPATIAPGAWSVLRGDDTPAPLALVLAYFGAIVVVAALVFTALGVLARLGAWGEQDRRADRSAGEAGTAFTPAAERAARS